MSIRLTLNLNLENQAYLQQHQFKGGIKLIFLCTSNSKHLVPDQYTIYIYLEPSYKSIHTNPLSLQPNPHISHQRLRLLDLYSILA